MTFSLSKKKILPVDQLSWQGCFDNEKVWFDSKIIPISWSKRTLKIHICEDRRITFHCIYFFTLAHCIISCWSWLLQLIWSVEYRPTVASDQSEAGVRVTWSVPTNQRPVSTSACGSGRDTPLLVKYHHTDLKIIFTSESSVYFQSHSWGLHTNTHSNII